MLSDALKSSRWTTIPERGRSALRDAKKRVKREIKNKYTEMAAIHLIGVIEKVQFLPQQNGGVIYLSEYRKGYKRKDGVRVEDKVDQWRVIFKQGLSKYVSDHFATGMTVEVKGDIRPFAVEREQTVDGYSVFLQSLNLFAYPRPSERLEKRAIRESQQSSSGVPDIASFNEPDF